DLVEIVDIARAQVDDAEARPDKAERPAAVESRPGERVHRGVAAHADEFARIARREERKNEIRTFIRTPDREGLTEILVMGGNADLGCEVDEAAQAQRRIDHGAAQRLAAACRLALEDVVGEDNR